MGAFVFLCDADTEQECLDRKLLGTNPGQPHQRHYRKVAVGDHLFLYNFETGILRGPFFATTGCLHNIEPKAWKRHYPWQVRVDDSTAFETPLSADELVGYVPLSRTSVGLLPPAEITDHQRDDILGAFARKNKVA
jgi:hypothetical protein